MQKVFYKGADCLTGVKFVPKAEATVTIANLNVTIKNQTQDFIPPDLLEGDESYNLTISGDTVKIDSN